MVKKAKKIRKTKKKSKTYTSPEPTHPHGFEYHIEVFPKTHVADGSAPAHQDVLDKLNELGAERWELILITDIVIDDGNVRAWFIRGL